MKSHARVHVNQHAITRAKKKLEEKAKSAHAHRLTVGIHEAEGAKPKLDYDHRETSTPLIAVAAAHELGLGVKERSWLRSWFDQNRSRLIKEMVEAQRVDYRGDASAIERQGEAWAHELQEWIEHEDGGLAALKPSTIARKEAAELDRPETPLFATGELVAAIKSMMDGGSP